MSQREISPLEDRLLNEAVANTEKEMFRGAFDQSEQDEPDDDGDRSSEEMEDDLGAEADASDDESGEQDDASEEGAEDESATDGKTEGEDDQARDDKGRFKAADKPQKGEGDGEDKGHMVPRSRLTEEANKRREAEEARKADQDRHAAELATLNRRIDDILARQAPPQQPQQQQQKTEPEKAQKPDMFTDPEGYEKWVLEQARADAASSAMDVYQKRFVESSMADAHETNGDEFVRAYENLTGINPVTQQVTRPGVQQDPIVRAQVAKIVNSPNPGRALMKWHNEQKTMQRVGADPAKFEEQIRNETREALMKDPEFRKQLLAEMKGEAAQADNGRPRNVTRFPKSLGDASGGSSAQRAAGEDLDGSEEGLFESVWADRRAG